MCDPMRPSRERMDGGLGPSRGALVCTVGQRGPDPRQTFYVIHHHNKRARTQFNV